MGRAACVGLCLGLILAAAMGQEGEKGKGGDAQPPGGLKPPGGFDDTYVTTAETKEKIPHPLSKKTKTLRVKGKKIEAPENMVFVPEGDFMMGEGQSEHKVWLDAYCIGKYEVTNAEWKAFVEATNFRPFPTHWKMGEPPEGRENHPVVFVSWEDAVKYCEWVKEGTGWEVRLPTEAEWEKAAGWDAKKKRKVKYPWGDQWDAKLCNSGWMLAKLGFRPNDEGADWTKKWAEWSGSEKGKEVLASGGNTMGVGSFKRVRGPYGCWDTAGNVYEWCQDWYVKEYYLLTDAKKNPWGPSEMEAEEVEFPGGRSAKVRLLRGGSWGHHSGAVARRAAATPALRAGARSAGFVWWLSCGGGDLRCV